MSQIAVIHTQNRIKDGPLAATSYIKYICTRRISWNHFGSFHHIILILGTAGPLWVRKFDARQCGSFSDKFAWLFENLGFKEVVQDASSNLLVLAGVGRSSPFSFLFP